MLMERKTLYISEMNKLELFLKSDMDLNTTLCFIFYSPVTFSSTYFGLCVR